nr:FtsQ-type POTRA domain-containing protein [Pseudonocardia acidicola]
MVDVKQVEVTGTLAVASPDVLAAAGIAQGTPLAAVDVGAVAARVATLPGVARVDVTRHWPHSVEIAVTERVAVALADSGKGLYLVDATGVAFRPAPQIPPPLPRLTFGGVGPGDPSTKAALVVLTALPGPLKNQVQTITAAPPANPGASPSVTLGLTGDRQVRWGSPDRSQQKATVLGPLLTQQGSVYDVASPELPTIRR